ncbi:CPBP family glutamic-type intramembrane protease [Kitasatospora sp. NPDC048540]|uniref:CPBP family glutamic-type intramembrane protease n=1 Tax=unclassified Kitasatospora TaxID=2633591 RepID=UPI0009EBDD46|nr:CPBP family glutamic-type intramembrane protease [Kitasatospora sp. MBT63]
MSTTLEETKKPAAVERPYESSFDPPGWVFDVRRLTAVSCVAAFAVGLWTLGGTNPRVLAGLLVVELVLMCLPWRVPRTMRSGLSFWTETLCGLLAPIGSLVLTAVTRPDWLGRGAAWWWYPIAVAVTGGLVALSNMRMRSLLSGELAFVFGPTPRAHGAARAFASALCPVGEEAVFRAPVLLASATTPLGLLGAIAFVARHHIQPGTNRRGTTRSTAVEISAAAALLLLTVASGSIYPALLAHVLNNIPTVVLELQRDNDDRGWA